ncbi:MAG: hypothetical protein ABIT61_13555, partial [Steroidobacteraceae bacterium]
MGLTARCAELEDHIDAGTAVDGLDAATVIAGLRKELSTSEAMVDALTVARDNLLNENAAMKR